MTTVDSCTDLMGRLQAGEDEAAREVFWRFAVQLIALAKQRQRFGRTDAEDVVQSAFKSFFTRQRQGKVVVRNWDSLWGLLTVITLRKCADRAGYFRAARRDVRREASATQGLHQPWELAPDRAPLPHEAAILAETVDRLFRCADADERPVLELSLQGYTAGEVSIQLGRALRTVHRLRERIRKRLERMQQDG